MASVMSECETVRFSNSVSGNIRESVSKLLDEAQSTLSIHITHDVLRTASVIYPNMSFKWSLPNRIEEA